MSKEYEWAVSQFGDDADSMSETDILSAYNKAHGKVAANAIQNQPLRLTDKEQKAATRAGISRESNGAAKLGKDGKVQGPGGLRYDPYKQHVIVDPTTGGYAIAPLGIGGEDEISVDGTSTGLGSTEDIAVNALKGDKGAQANQGYIQSVGGSDKVTTTEGESKKFNEQGKPEEEKQTLADKATLDIGKQQQDPERAYLIADAIATYLRNASRDFGNVAAAYTGGSYNNERDESLLSQRAAQRAQAETDEAILKDFPNSKEAAELKGAQLANANKETQRQYGLMLMNRFYDKDGHFIGDVNSADFKNAVTLCNQLMNGGGAKDDMLSQFASRLFQLTGF